MLAALIIGNQSVNILSYTYMVLLLASLRRFWGRQWTSGRLFEHHEMKCIMQTPNAGAAAGPCLPASLLSYDFPLCALTCPSLLFVLAC